MSGSQSFQLQTTFFFPPSTDSWATLQWKRTTYIIHRIRAHKCIVFHLSTWRCQETVGIAAKTFLHKMETLSRIIVWEAGSRVHRAIFHTALLVVDASLSSLLAVSLAWMATNCESSTYSVQRIWERLEMPSTAQLSLNKVLLRLILIKWIYRRCEHELWWAAAGRHRFDVSCILRLCAVSRRSHGITFVFGKICVRVRLRVFTPECSVARVCVWAL